LANSAIYWYSCFPFTNAPAQAIANDTAKNALLSMIFFHDSYSSLSSSLYKISSK